MGDDSPVEVRAPPHWITAAKLGRTVDLQAALEAEPRLLNACDAGLLARS
jgi:hypothetical protein